MTDLREARIAEAKRRADDDYPAATFGRLAHSNAALNHLIDLIEQDWRPEPEVDAVTLAAREWLKEHGVPLTHKQIDAGECDKWSEAHAFRAGHALANHPDTKRMDWLERQSVDILPMKSGTINHPFSSTEPLRTKIDRAMGGGE